MNPESKIFDTVMRRVRFMHVVESATPKVAALSMFALALWGVGREVWVAKVYENVRALAGFSEMLSFSLDAFLGTELLVQLLVGLAAASLFWLAYGFARPLLADERPAF